MLIVQEQLIGNVMKITHTIVKSVGFRMKIQKIFARIINTGWLYNSSTGIEQKQAGRIMDNP